MRRLFLVAVLALSACAGDAATASPSPSASIASPDRTISGTFALVNGEAVEREITSMEVSSCRGTGGYDDIATGLGVVIRDADGSVIGTSELVTDHASVDLDDTDVCIFTFEVPDLPESEFYSVEVGDRGELTFSEVELEALDWSVEASVGG